MPRTNAYVESMRYLRHKPLTELTLTELPLPELTLAELPLTAIRT